jgi:3-dehydroquinate dehydratase / shikimate dehydrogenase
MTSPLLCVTVTAANMTALRAARDGAAEHADLVELRLDGVRDVDVQGALAGRRTPVIVTCRPPREGGRFDGAEDERIGLLARAAALGAEYVDIEWDSAHAAVVAGRVGRGVVLSSHDFDGVPKDLRERVRAMRATGAEVVKIAVTARSLADNLPLLAIGREATDRSRLALVAMGEPGLPSRLLAAKFGSCWAYSGEAVAPGQLTPDRMVSEFRFRGVTASSRIFGIAGRPISHSVSPAMHNAAFQETGFDGVYVPLAARDAADFRAFAEGVGLTGASITAPFKLDVLRAADERDEAAQLCGAANSVQIREGRWLVRNTDVEGFLDPLETRKVDLRGVRVTVVGAGGAARAVVVGLSRRGARVTVCGRREDRAREVAALAAGGRATAGQPAPGDWDILVNATPVGTWPDVEASPVDPGALAGGGLVYDLVYNPIRTALMRDAEHSGCETIGGLEMLVAQAVRQFEWWTGTRAPRGRMRDAALERLHRMAGGA